jgi:hypothetical protein
LRELENVGALEACTWLGLRAACLQFATDKDVAYVYICVCVNMKYGLSNFARQLLFPILIDLDI